MPRSASPATRATRAATPARPSPGAKRTGQEVAGSRVAFSYARVSTKRQTTENRDGLERQTDAFLPFCERHGLTPANDHLQDAGVSAFRGSNRKRGALGVFLEAAQAGAVPDGAVLVVEDLDRFSRRATSYQEAMLGELFALGLALGIVRDDLIVDRATYDSRLDVRLQLLVRRDAAHDYSQKNSERGEAAAARARARGEKTAWPRPFWCDWDAAAQDFTPNGKEAIVRRMVELCLEGFGMAETAKVMNREGSTSTTGKPFTFAMVRKSLMDRRVLGERAWLNRGEVVQVSPGYFPPIVSVSDFDQCRALIHERDNKKGRHGRGKHLHNIFQGVVFCSCGRGLTHLIGGKRHIGQVYEYLRCLGKINGTCTEPNHPYDEKWLLRAFMGQRWDRYFHRPSHSHQRRQLLAKERELDALAAQHRGTAQTLEGNLATPLSPEAVEMLVKGAREATAKAEAVERERDGVRHQLQQLDAKPSGDAMAAQIRERVEGFLATDRHDVVERRKFNNWVSTLGVRLTLAKGPGTITQLSVGGLKPIHLPDGGVVVPGGEFHLKGVPQAVMDRLAAQAATG